MAKKDKAEHLLETWWNDGLPKIPFLVDLLENLIDRIQVLESEPAPRSEAPTTGALKNETTTSSNALIEARRRLASQLGRSSMEGQEIGQAIENLVRALLQESSPITAIHSQTEAAEIAPEPTTKANQWDAEESTAATIPVSSQSGQQDTESGPVEQGSECAHPLDCLRIDGIGSRQNWWIGEQKIIPPPDSVQIRCVRCNASWRYDRTLVPAAAPTTSTSRSPASPSSVESELEGAMSPSSGLTRRPPEARGFA